MFSDDPVVVFFYAKTCAHGVKLKENMDKVQSEMKKLRSRLRFVVIELESFRDGVDVNKYPKDIMRYSVWYPMTLLVPGSVWNKATENLGPNNDTKIIDGVQVMNGTMVDGRPRYKLDYKGDYVGKYVSWLKDALNAKDFGIASGEIPIGYTTSSVCLETCYKSYNTDGELHSIDDQEAYIETRQISEKKKYLYIDEVGGETGSPHPEELPVISSEKRWYENGKLHRKNGPAVIGHDGSESFYLNGSEVRKEAVMGANSEVTFDKIKSIVENLERQDKIALLKSLSTELFQ